MKFRLIDVSKTFREPAKLLTNGLGIFPNFTKNQVSVCTKRKIAMWSKDNFKLKLCL